MACHVPHKTIISIIVPGVESLGCSTHAHTCVRPSLSNVVRRSDVCASSFSQSGDDNPIVYSTPTSEWDVLEDFEPGQIIEIDIIFTNYHWVSDPAGAPRRQDVVSDGAVLVV